jgi:hypothetical protein
VLIALARSAAGAERAISGVLTAPPSGTYRGVPVDSVSSAATSGIVARAAARPVLRLTASSPVDAVNVMAELGKSSGWSIYKLPAWFIARTHGAMASFCVPWAMQILALRPCGASSASLPRLTRRTAAKARALGQVAPT